MTDDNQNGELVAVPSTALVQCPLENFKFTLAERCAQCQHFAGLHDRFPGSSHPFAVRYTVGCTARPVQREIKELAACPQ